MEEILFVMDLLGTIAFAASGALTAIGHRMDVFGVCVLAVITATGGGVLRDVIIGALPPATFLNPVYAGLSIFIALCVFLVLYIHPKAPQKLTQAYNLLMFVFDTLGIAAFTMDGVAIGLSRGYRENAFLLVFLGVITGVGGGVIRDVLADQMPDILRKHVYALASILGALLYAILARNGLSPQIGMIAGFSVIVVLRVLAMNYHWNLPKIPERKS